LIDVFLCLEGDSKASLVFLIFSSPFSQSGSRGDFQQRHGKYRARDALFILGAAFGTIMEVL
jgi:hypothetical protein